MRVFATLIVGLTVVMMGHFLALIIFRKRKWAARYNKDDLTLRISPGFLSAAVIGCAAGFVLNDSLPEDWFGIAALAVRAIMPAFFLECWFRIHAPQDLRRAKLASLLGMLQTFMCAISYVAYSGA